MRPLISCVLMKTCTSSFIQASTYTFLTFYCKFSRRDFPTSETMRLGSATWVKASARRSLSLWVHISRDRNIPESFFSYLFLHGRNSDLSFYPLSSFHRSINVPLFAHCVLALCRAVTPKYFPPQLIYNKIILSIGYINFTNTIIKVKNCSLFHTYFN